jgi:hypothetical protein
LHRPDEPAKVEVVDVEAPLERRVHDAQGSQRVALPVFPVQQVPDPAADRHQRDRQQQERHAEDADLRLVGEDPIAERTVESQQLRRTHEAEERRRNREHHHGGHHPRDRLVRMAVSPVLAEEREEQGAHHVEGGHGGRCRRGAEHEPVLFPERDGDDLVLGPVAGEWRDPHERRRSHEEHGEGPRHRLPEPSHLRHVVRVHRVDHRAGREEQQRLERGVGEHVEQAAAEAVLAERQPREHVGELRDRGVREHPFEVVLDERQHGPEEHGDRGDDGHDRQGPVRLGEHREHAGDQIDAGYHHRRGVDERRRGGGAGHGVGEPHVERELRGLPHGAAEQEERAGEQEGVRDLPRLRAVKDGGDVGRADREDQREDAEGERHVAHPGRDERLVRGVHVFLLLPPESDDQVGADADALPSDE